jgi:hypothetical protein
VRFEVILIGVYRDQCYVGCDTVLITREIPVAVLLNLLSPSSVCLRLRGITSHDQMNGVLTYKIWGVFWNVYWNCIYWLLHGVIFLWLLFLLLSTRARHLWIVLHYCWCNWMQYLRCLLELCAKCVLLQLLNLSRYKIFIGSFCITFQTAAVYFTVWNHCFLCRRHTTWPKREADCRTTGIHRAWRRNNSAELFGWGRSWLI